MKKYETPLKVPFKVILSREHIRQISYMKTKFVKCVKCEKIHQWKRQCASEEWPQIPEFPLKYLSINGHESKCYVVNNNSSLAFGRMSAGIVWCFGGILYNQVFELTHVSGPGLCYLGNIFFLVFTYVSPISLTIFSVFRAVFSNIMTANQHFYQ